MADQSKSNWFENRLLEHIFNNADVTNVGDAGGLQGSSTAGSLYVALHTATPDETGDQTTNECTYGSYARVAVSRGGAAWTVTNNSVSPVSEISFPAATSGSETATHFSIGLATSGAGEFLYYGQITPNIAISSGVTPKLTTASAVTED